MKYLNGKEAIKGDAVVYETPDKISVVGYITDLYIRNQTVRISGYPLQVLSEKVVLASDAYAAVLEDKAASDATIGSTP